MRMFGLKRDSVVDEAHFETLDDRSLEKLRIAIFLQRGSRGTSASAPAPECGVKESVISVACGNLRESPGIGWRVWPRKRRTPTQ
jgi:hypothetical protein